MYSFQKGYNGKRSPLYTKEDRLSTTYNTTYNSSYNSHLSQTTNRDRRVNKLSDDTLSSHVEDENHGKRRTFFPVDRDWQELTAKKLGLKVVKHNKYGTQKNYYDKTPPKEVISVRGDGNCFFRAICVIITGAEDEHMKVREAVTKHVSDHPDMYRSFLQSRGGMSQYLTNMRRSREWATDVELLATANLLKTIIEVYFPYPVSNSETEYRWQTFQPLNLPDITFPIIYISNKYDHFDPVVDIDTPELEEGNRRDKLLSDRHTPKYDTSDRYMDSRSPTRRLNDPSKQGHGAITF